MKKVLAFLGLFAVISMTTPAFAGPHGGSGGHHGGGHVVHAGPGFHGHGHGGRGHYGAPPPPPPRGHYHHYRGGAVIGGVLARRSYWSYPYYDYRLGYYDDYYYRPYYRGMYINLGVPIRF